MLSNSVLWSGLLTTSNPKRPAVKITFASKVMVGETVDIDSIDEDVGILRTVVTLDRSPTARQDWNAAIHSEIAYTQINPAYGHPTIPFGHGWWYPNLLSVMVFGIAGDYNNDGAFVDVQVEGQVVEVGSNDGLWYEEDDITQTLPPPFRDPKTGAGWSKHASAGTATKLVHKIVSEPVDVKINRCLPGSLNIKVYYKQGNVRFGRFSMTFAPTDQGLQLNEITSK